MVALIPSYILQNRIVQWLTILLISFTSLLVFIYWHLQLNTGYVFQYFCLWKIVVVWAFFFPKVRTFSIKLCFCGFLMERMEVTCFLCITTPMNISSLVFSLALMCKYSFSLSRSSWSQCRCFLHGQPSNLVGLEPALEVLYAICFFRMQFTSEYCEIYSGGSSVNLSHSIRLCQGRTGILLLFMSICS